MKYQITKEQCRKMISGICDFCGGELSPIETVNNSDEPTYWVGCKECHRFTNETQKIEYDIAKEMVVNGHFVAYSHMDYPEDKEGIDYYTKTQISGTVSIIKNVLKIYKHLSKEKV